jgi:hypothetical protein
MYVFHRPCLSGLWVGGPWFDSCQQQETFLCSTGFLQVMGPSQSPTQEVTVGSFKQVKVWLSPDLKLISFLPYISNPEDGGDMFLRKSDDFPRVTLCYIPQGRIIHTNFVWNRRLQTKCHGDAPTPRRLEKQFLGRVNFLLPFVLTRIA